MNCVILQPSYIPWRGYFHQIQKADLFIFYDDVQYDKHGWRNRNRIKTSQDGQWLTIPVHSKGVVVENIGINEIEIAWEQPWSERHLRAIKQSYNKAPYFKEHAGWLEEIFSRRPERLADFTIPLTIEIARKLDIQHTQFMRSSELKISGQKTDRLIEILTQVGATHYISGPSARSYIEEEKFQGAGISLEYMEYNYPEYVQLYPPFDPFVSTLDLLFMTGPEAPKYIY
ncbi:MAG: WbqC family protein [Anaerolineaceae bacterium]|nr:WbqC family protein [Anaerolineaceae bacterium]